MAVMGSNWAETLRPSVIDIFSTVVSRPDPMRDYLYSTINSSGAYEEYMGTGSRRRVPRYAGAVPFENSDAGYKARLNNVLLVDGLQIQKTFMEDERYGMVSQMISDFSANFPDTKEDDAVQTFVNAFTDSGANILGESVAGADSVGLCSAAHPYSPVASGSTQANEGTLALSLANVDVVRQAMQNWTDDKGKLMAVNPDTILVPTELEREALKIFPQSAGLAYEPDSAEYNVNVFARQAGGHPVNVVVWNRLTDANAWWMIDYAAMKRFLIWQERVMPTIETLPQVNPEIAEWSGRMRYTTGWKHWAWLYGNNPS